MTDMEMLKAWLADVGESYRVESYEDCQQIVAGTEELVFFTFEHGGRFLGMGHAFDPAAEANERERGGRAGVTGDFGEQVVRSYLAEHATDENRGDLERSARFILGFLGVLPEDDEGAPGESPPPGPEDSAPRKI